MAFKLLTSVFKNSAAFEAVSGTTGANGNTVFSVESGHHTATVADHHDNTDSREVSVSAGEIIQVTFELGAAGRPATGSH